MHRNFALLTVVSAGLSMGFASQARASGFALHEQGASGLGNAYAGAAAVAEDATTIWWNPAGMARLAPGKHFSLGATYIDPSTKFNDTGSTPAALSNPALNGSGGDAGQSKVVPSFFLASDLTPEWSLGLGVTVPFGLATKYDSNWVGRFQGIESKVETVNVNPVVSVKVSEHVSLGGGMSYQEGKIDLLSAVNYSAIAFGAGGAPLLGAIGGPGVEGQNKTSLSGHAWGYNFGILSDLGRAARVGVHYRSSLSYTLHGSTTFSNRPAALAAGLPDGDVQLSLKTPDSLAFSGVYQLSDRWQFLADATLTRWSTIQQQPLVRTSGSQSGSTLDTLVFKFRDTWRYSLGTTARMSNALALKAGVAYDQSPVPDSATRSVRLPDQDRLWFSVGASYNVTRRDKVDLGYSYIKVRDADINNNQTAAGKGIVTGTYSATINLFGLQYQHTF